MRQKVSMRGLIIIALAGSSGLFPLGCRSHHHAFKKESVRVARPAPGVVYASSQALSLTPPDFSIEEEETLGGIDMRPIQLRTAIILADVYGPNGQIGSGHGSGAIVTKDGLIVTNYHVVDHAVQHAALTGEEARVEVILPYMNEKGRIKRRGGTFPGRVINVMPSKDLALVKLDEAPRDVGYLNVVTSAGDAVPGFDCYRVGSPSAGSPWMVRSGVVSTILDWPEEIDVRALRSQSTPVQPPLRVRASVISSDNAIGGGDSGGPLVNDKGELIGVTFAGPPGDGVAPVGYAIHAEHVRDLMARSLWGSEDSPVDFHVGGFPISQRSEYAPVYLLNDEGNEELVGVWCEFSWTPPGPFSWMKAKLGHAFYSADPSMNAQLEARVQSGEVEPEVAYTPLGLWGVESRGEFRWTSAYLEVQGVGVGVASASKLTGEMVEVRWANVEDSGWKQRIADEGVDAVPLVSRAWRRPGRGLLNTSSGKWVRVHEDTGKSLASIEDVDRFLLLIDAVGAVSEEDEDESL